MTIQDVIDAIERIKRIADDNEMAHHAEDVLNRSVLAAIRDGDAEDPREMARLALTTKDIEFARWYA